MNLEQYQYNKKLITCYPELVTLIQTFDPSIKGYNAFLRLKERNGDKVFYEKYIKSFKAETIESPTFGTKTFYKADPGIMFADLFCCVHGLNGQFKPYAVKFQKIN